MEVKVIGELNYSTQAVTELLGKIGQQLPATENESMKNLLELVRELRLKLLALEVKGEYSDVKPDPELLALVGTEPQIESFIRRDLAERVATIPRLRISKEFEMGKGTLLVSESTPIVDIEIEGFNLFWHFLVVSDLSEELIIGVDFLQRWKIKLAPENERIIVDPKALKLKLVSI